MKNWLFIAFAILNSLSHAAEVVVYERPDGGVSVLSPAPGLSAAEVATLDVPAGRSYLVVNDSAIALNPAFQGAWTYSASAPGGVVIDMTKARTICLSLIRQKLVAAAEDVLLETDVELARKRQRWREILNDPRIPAANNESDLLQILQEVAADLPSVGVIGRRAR